MAGGPFLPVLPVLPVPVLTGSPRPLLRRSAPLLLSHHLQAAASLGSDRWAEAAASGSDGACNVESEGAEGWEKRRRDYREAFDADSGSGNPGVPSGEAALTQHQ